MTDQMPNSKTDNVINRRADMFVAIELSRAKWLVAVSAPGYFEKSMLRELPGGDGFQLLEFIAVQRAALTKCGCAGVRVISCFEAGYDGFWLHRLLTEHDVISHVLDGASLLVDRRAKLIKTDRVDARRLLRAITAYWNGDRDACRVVHVPTVEQEDLRRTSRERERLVRERTGHINRIRGLFTAQGIKVQSIKDGRWLTHLDQMKTGDGRPLPRRLSDEIRREWDRFLLVRRQLRDVEAERNAVVSGADQSSADGETIRKLTRLRGIGADFATMLTREVFFRPFKNRRAVAKYFGLTPAPFASGDSSRDQGIDKAGNPRARYVAVEAAWMWLRHQPLSDISRWFNGRVRGDSGRARRVGIIAVARKLMVALWRYIESGRVPAGVVFKA